MRIKLDNVSKSYISGKKSIKAIDNVSIEFDRGLHVITGGNASGKSTLIRLIAGISRPDHGVISVGKYRLNIDCNNECLSMLRREYIGFMPQTLMVPKSMEAEKACGLPLILKNVNGWREVVHMYFEEFGLKDCMGRKGGELSVGQRQRIAFIRSIIFNPPILLLDEPFSHQDEDSVRKIVEFLNLISNDKIIILATPDLTLLKVYRLKIDRIISLFRGRIRSITD